MMTTPWQVVTVYLHLSPKAEPCQKHLAQKKVLLRKKGLLRSGYIMDFIPLKPHNNTVISIFQKENLRQQESEANSLRWQVELMRAEI